MDLLEELNDLREQRQRLREQLQALIPTTVTTPSPFDFTADFSGFMSKVAANTDRNREMIREMSFLATELSFVERQIIAILGNPALVR